MVFVEALMNGMLSTLLIGALAKLVAALFASDHSSRIAGFCVAIGYSVRRYSYGGPIDEQALVAATTALGSLLALVVLWLWLLKKEVSADEPRTD